MSFALANDNFRLPVSGINSHSPFGHVLLSLQSLRQIFRISVLKKMAAVRTRLVPTTLLLPRLLGDIPAKTVRYSSGDAASPQRKDGFFQKLWNLGDTLPHTDAHSKILTATLATYELQCNYISSVYSSHRVELRSI